MAGAAPGTRLPSVRELMVRHRAGPATVQRAIGVLVARGVVETRPGRGTFVAAARSVVTPDPSWQAVPLGARSIDADALETLIRPPVPGAIVLSTGYLPAELQPTALLGAALARAARRPGAWDRVPLAGLTGLRAYFAAEVGASAGDVLITPGGQAALAACFRGLAAPGAPIIVESPTYLGALAAARAQGLVPVPVPADRDGIRPDLLADALAATGARVVYLQPCYANPHGATLAFERRAAVLDAVRAAGAFIVEDDAFRDLALGPPSRRRGPRVLARRAPARLRPAPRRRRAAAPVRGRPGRARGAHPVAHQGRGARVADRGGHRARARRRAAPGRADRRGPVRHGAAPGGGARGGRRARVAGAPAAARKVLRERRDALVAALPMAVDVPAGGMNLWVPLEPGTDDRELAARAAAAGVIVSPGRPFFAAEPPGPFLRLTFAAEPPERLAEGVRRLYQ